jgi:flagellar biosynthesis protein FlhG
MIGQAQRLIEIQTQLGSKNTHLEKNIITFSSGKGGTGKSFLAMNIAFALSGLKKKILLVDLDLNLGNAHLLLNLAPDKTIGHFLAQKELFKNIITKYNEHLHFIFGNSGMEFPPADFDSLFKKINEISVDYDFVLIDSGAGVNNDVLQTIQRSYSNCIVTTPETTAVMDAYVLIKMLIKNNYHGKNLVIINKSLSQENGLEAFLNLNTAAGHFLNNKLELLGIVPFDIEAAKSVQEQYILFIRNSASPVITSVLSIAQKLLEIHQMANISHS